MDKNEKWKPPTILIVEDEALLRVHTACLLECEGHKVFEAANTEDALRILEVNAGIEVLFTDIQMPGRRNGLALARVVYRRWPHIKLLITSGREKPAEQEMPGDGRFIPKPLRPGELFSEIKNFF